MKKVILFLPILFTVLLFTSCNEDENYSFEGLDNQVIGKLSNNSPIITYNSDELFRIFSKTSNYEHKKHDFINLSIQKFTDNDKEVFALCAYTKDDTRYATLLNIDNNKNFTILRLNNSGTITCVTQGCSSNAGCMPHNSNGYWTCTSCSSDCTKTTSVKLD